MACKKCENLPTNLVLLAKEGTVLEGMIDSLNESGRSCGVKMNVEKYCGNENLKATIQTADCDTSENNRIMWNIFNICAAR